MKHSPQYYKSPCVDLNSCVLQLLETFSPTKNLISVNDYPSPSRFLDYVHYSVNRYCACTNFVLMHQDTIHTNLRINYGLFYHLTELHLEYRQPEERESIFYEKTFLKYMYLAKTDTRNVYSRVKFIYL